MKNHGTTHLKFLDGLRGLSAMYVLLHHAYMMLLYEGVGEHGGWHGVMTILRPLQYGQFAVDVFIVLSGYCLMLPLVRTSGLLKNGFKGYIKRRALRIVPPYYAALTLSLIIISVHNRLPHLSNTDDLFIPKFPEAGDLITHLFLAHNLVNKWSHGINAPMWSVATEWQIYFIFPALLLPAWRHWGNTAVVILSFAFAALVNFLVPDGLQGAAPWLLGLFAFGMIAATFDFSAESRKTTLGNVPWGTLSMILSVVMAMVGVFLRGWFRAHPWIMDPLVGLIAISLILHCKQAASTDKSNPPPFALNLFSSWWAVRLGAFSYSLYLIHFPLLGLASSLYRRFTPSIDFHIIATFSVGVPLITGLAYLFHLAFERPFMPGRPRSAQAAEVAAEWSPAP